MDNQQNVPSNNNQDTQSSNQPLVNSQPQPLPQPQPQPIVTSSAPTPPNYSTQTANALPKKLSTTKRVIACIIGALLVLFALSIVQGQISHSFDIFGIIMILFFGGIGLVLLYSGIFVKKNK